MSDIPAFFSKDFGRTGLTPTVGLGIPLYVIRATFIHPTTKVATSLPSHHWLLFEERGSTVISLGRVSDIAGICVINDIQDPGSANLVLAFVPAPLDVRSSFLNNEEAWIDLDKNDWASPQPDRSKIERRNLYRIPAWTTRRKAIRGGGFKDWPSNARPENRASGFLTREEVLRHSYGTLAKPWDIAIDFGWPRAVVRYFYFDWGRDKRNVLPPGLVVDVVPSVRDAGLTRLGSGTAVTSTVGAAHILIEGAPSVWSGAEIEFRAPPESRVDLVAPEPGAGVPDTRLTADGPCPSDPYHRNRLPTQWHSLGQRCTAKLASGRVLARASWFEISSQLASETGTSDDVIIDFHLDDVSLRNADGSATGFAGRPALFDHYLAILEPVPARPHQSDTTVDQSVIAADKVFTIGKPLSTGRRRLDTSTRLIHIEGRLFDLRDGRVEGKPGTTPCLGARAAFHNHHPSAKFHNGNPFLQNRGFYELHLVDVPGVLDPRINRQLMHLLIFASYQIELNGLGTAVLDECYKRLLESAERWSQGSPGVPSASKDYRIVSADSAKREELVIRWRAYFGENKIDPILFIELKDGTTRAHTRQPIRYLTSGRIRYFTGDSSWDGSAAADGSDSDGYRAGWHTLAHEFGHLLGLPDEYGEDLDPKSVDPNAVLADPRVLAYSPPKEDMPTDYRPFYSDKHAMMQQNRLPRLRHYWHHVEALNQDDAFRDLAGRPFVARHEHFGGTGLDYLRPDRKHPYSALFAEKDLPGSGKGDCALFALGQDEGTAEALFGSTAVPSASRFDGLIIVRSRIRFRFDEGTVAPNERWSMIWRDFYCNIFNSMNRQYLRFALVGGRKLARIAVMIQPHCAVGRGPFTGDNIVLMVSRRVPPPPNVFALGTTSAIDLDITHFNANCVLRAILGRPTMRPNPPGSPVANTLPLTVDDLEGVARLVDRELGDAHATRRVIAF